MATSKITVFPVKQEVELKPGEVYEGKITIAEPADADNDFHYQIEVVPYSSPDTENEVVLTERLDQLLMAEWISISEPKGVLEPNEVKEVPFKITVPESVPDGGQYATLFVHSTAKDAGEGKGMNVQDVAGINSVIYAKIAGTSRHAAEFVSQTLPGFSTTNELDWEVVVRNQGNVHEQITTTITAKNALNGESISPMTEQGASEQSNLVMPGTMRILRRRIDGLGNLGVYNLTNEVSYGDEVYAFSQTVVICPLWFIALIFITLTVLAGTIVMLIRRNRGKRAKVTADSDTD